MFVVNTVQYCGGQIKSIRGRSRASQNLNHSLCNALSGAEQGALESASFQFSFVFSFPQAPHSLHFQVLRHLPWVYRSNCVMWQTSSTQMKCKPLVVGAAEVTRIRPGGNRREGLAAAQTALSHFPVLLSQCISMEARKAHRDINYCWNL